MRRASVLIICILYSLSAFAQDAATGAIHGTVLDPAGSRIAQASIVAVNSDTGARYSATSDAEGRFSLDLLPPGDYSARAVAQGMSPQVTPPLHVDIGAAAELEFRLTIAGAQEKITVSEAPQLVDTKSSAVSTLLDERAIADLPLNGRRFSDLMLLSPGVTKDPRSLTSATNGDLSFGGLRGFQNSFLVDGGDFNNAFFAQARGRYRAPYQFSTEVVGGLGEQSSTSLPSRDPITGTALDSTFSATVHSAPPTLSSPSGLTTVSSRPEALSAAPSRKTRSSSSPDSISTTSMFPMSSNF